VCLASISVSPFVDLRLLYDTLMHLLLYFSIDNARVIYTKESLNSLKMNMRGIHLKGMGGTSNARQKYYLIFIEH
jgi:hypothetical protein